MPKKFELFKFRSLRAKFLAVVVPFLMLSTAIVFGISEVTARRDADQKLQEKLSDLVAIQSAVLAESMWNVADEQIELILAALAIDPDVRAAAVFDESGNEISSVGEVSTLETSEFLAKSAITYTYGGRQDIIGQLTVALTSDRMQTESRQRLLFAIGLAFLLMISIVTVALIGYHRTVGVPLERLLGSINRFRNSGERNLVEWHSHDEIGALVTAFNEMQTRQRAYEEELRNARDHLETRVDERTRELKEKSSALEQLSNQLAKFLPPQVYDSIFSGQREVKVASSRKKLTIFFSDIAGFTEAADRLESEELIQLVNRYLTEMSQIAIRYGATIDKYMGDGIMIFFGDPESRGVKEDALACLRMATDMRRRMHELADIWQEAGIERPLRVRMGIHTGYCTVGNFGSEARMDYTIIGGGANTAARLEAAAQPGEILISYQTFANVKDAFLCEEEGRIDVKGIAYPVATYRVVDSFESLGAKSRHYREDHPNIKIDLNLESINEDDRDRAAAILQEALSLLSRSEPAGSPGHAGAARKRSARG